jgi:tRNA (cmo5U34)-methyltransferase
VGSKQAAPTVEGAFDRAAGHYDDWVRTAIPSYDQLFGKAVELLPFAADAELEVLDLGAGTGLFAAHVARSHPRAAFVLCDLAAEMLELARQRFEALPNRAELRESDLREIDAHERYDAVISSLAIHHLEHDEKRALFGRIFRALRPGGVFVNVDQVRGETPAFEALYWDSWLRMVRAAGAAEEQIQASIERRRRFDRDARLADQVAWLREAGFDADAVLKLEFMAVFLARKTPVAS